MSIIPQDYFRSLKTFSFAMLFCLGAVCFAYAASTNLEVRQEVTKEGNGETGEESGGGFFLPVDATRPRISDVRIYDIDQTTANISFKTDVVCLAELYYGRTNRFESGPYFAHPESYLVEHEFELKDLVPGAKYYVKLVARNQKGVVATDTSYSFYTVPMFLTVPNVGSLTGEQVKKTIVLDWQNPTDENFRGVQINKSIGEPALEPDEGEKVFSGMMESFVDANIMDKTTYYYTVFSYDAQGNFSSGVWVPVTTSVDKLGGATQPETPVPPVTVDNVVNLAAVADVAAEKIVLEWQCPQSEPACSVEIRRNTNFPSFSALVGDKVYAGKETSFADTGVKKEQMYFYTVFTVNEEGIYSKGRMVAASLAESGAPVGDAIWKDVTFLDVETGVVLTLQEDQTLSILGDGILGINYGAQSLTGNLKAVVAELDGASYVLDFNEATQSYETSFVLPAVGEYPLTLDFIGTDDEIVSERSLGLRVLAEGRVYTMKNEKLFAKGLTLGRFVCRLGNMLWRYDENCMYEASVADAEVGVSVKNHNGLWENWKAHEYKQTNPSLADADGRFGFTVPNGEYEISIEKRGFERARVSKLVKDNIISENVKIYVKKENKYGILLLIIAAISIAIYMKKRSLDKRKNKREKKMRV